mgnify:CR=1 FL=1
MRVFSCPAGVFLPAEWALSVQGGMPGAERLRDSAALMDLVSKQQQADQLYAAICATPAVAFEPAGGWCGGLEPSVSSLLSRPCCFAGLLAG